MREIQRLLKDNPGLYEELRHRRRGQANRARVLLDELKATHPTVFDEAEPLPLSVTVIKDIRFQYYDYSQAEIEQALLIWCRKKIYRDVLKATAVRYGLDAKEAV